MNIKLSLKQKIAIRFHCTRIKAIAIVSPSRAAEKTFKLFCTPFTKPALKVPAIFNQAKKLSLIIEKVKVNGWYWTPANTNGKKIIVAHGFSSSTFKFYKYVEVLMQHGFEVIAFDAPAHGISKGKVLHAMIYKNMLLEIENKFGPIYGIVGHSIGGLAAGFAAEEMPELEKLVIIAPATETTRAIDNFFQVLPLGETIKKGLINYIVKISGEPITYFSVPRSVQNITASILWVHDDTDPICPIEDVLPVMKLDLPHVQFHITHGLGHNNIYKNNKVVQKVVEFLNK